ncbi:hypothetical protein P280DRAFT_553947 [Massarina eburnea CBS 473.64]|uniref:Uncharacterized protein n=1 Tax=Massarina eburnea CBS 473.64 TaxID=1395130 RepID=A0A6A6RIA7_9PLEO|nr:hypothetical protein P280DRAFT_553947 [Massarina eburnea CBS 473.64]
MMVLSFLLLVVQALAAPADGATKLSIRDISSPDLPTALPSTLPSDTAAYTSLDIPIATNIPSISPNSPVADEGKWKYDLTYTEECQIHDDGSIFWVALVGYNVFWRPDGQPLTSGNHYYSMNNFTAILNLGQFSLWLGGQREDKPGVAHLYSTWGNGCPWEFGDGDTNDDNCGGCKLSSVTTQQPPSGSMKCPPYNFRIRTFACWIWANWGPAGTNATSLDDSTDVTLV